ncbi:erythronate-4-phosphate dehydrogenase [Candidatus Photodesmus blepharus]|uniref:Erythronate-4-phosphate dehydrogenase n=1 Tax=Candidatus Photodesmus blepharonis TaxID=1179155 RepID=A0A084CN45_9GAMM|nr:4-phosphoerythronate dehydrogenase [Candidatus Photodesmus blepharus]KEY91224.1 erythronate-4-phosphate dehydrogenase [Candidatus Photodesmus blepharus]
MQILIDKEIPYSTQLFSHLGRLILKSGRELISDDLIGVEALIIRSVTKVDRRLLEKANRLRFVGTVTAGVDHVDQGLLKERGIFFIAAFGYNRISVAEYVLSVLMVLVQQEGCSISDKIVGIIGAGQIGSYLALLLKSISVEVLINDPLKQDEGDMREFTALDVLLKKADVITLHTPITRHGKYPTYHLINEQILDSFRSDQILINAARGGIVNNVALKKRLLKGDGFTAVLDVFEFEPEIDMELLPLLKFASPHIAGYSLEGSTRGIMMIFDDFCNFFQKKNQLKTNELFSFSLAKKVLLCETWDEAILHDLTQLIYNVHRSDGLFRREVHKSSLFDKIRRKYRNKREYSAITLVGCAECNFQPLSNLGFKIKVNK